MSANKEGDGRLNEHGNESDGKEIAVLRREARTANGIMVFDKPSAEVAMQAVATISGVKKKWVDYWAPLKETAHKTWKGIVAREKEGTDLCDSAISTIKGKVLTWQDGEERKARAEQALLQAEADEKARRERERLEKEAAKLKTHELKAERLEQAASVVAEVVTVDPPELDGGGIRRTWVAVLVSKEELFCAAAPGTVARTFIMFDQKTADAFARATKGASPVSGIRFEERKGVSLART